MVEINFVRLNFFLKDYSVALNKITDNLAISL